MVRITFRQISTLAHGTVLLCLIYGVATGADVATEYARGYYTGLVLVTGLLTIAANIYLMLKRNRTDGPRIAAGLHAATKTSPIQWGFGVLSIGLLFAADLTALATGTILVILALCALRHTARKAMAAELCQTG